MRAPEPLAGLRLVAPSSVLDGLVWPDGVTALRFAADDLFVIGAPGAELTGALVEQERGFAGWWLTADELHDSVLQHIEWALPTARPALGQGLIAGVPARLWLTQDGALLLCAAAYAHELEARLP